MSKHHTEEFTDRSAVAHQSVVESECADRDADACAPVLEPSLLAHIHQLNLDYLELLIAERDTPRGAAQLAHLPPRQRTALASLSPRALHAVAKVPYTLYSLGFEEEHFWIPCARTPRRRRLRL